VCSYAKACGVREASRPTESEPNTLANLRQVGLALWAELQRCARHDLQRFEVDVAGDTLNHEALRRDVN